MREADASNACLNREAAPHAGMPPAYDLILERAGGRITRSIHVQDAAEAWRPARERYPESIRAVVCQDIAAADLPARP